MHAFTHEPLGYPDLYKYIYMYVCTWAKVL